MAHDTTDFMVIWAAGFSTGALTLWAMEMLLEWLKARLPRNLS
jgi:hypothetical protein